MTPQWKGLNIAIGHGRCLINGKVINSENDTGFKSDRPGLRSQLHSLLLA